MGSLEKRFQAFLNKNNKFKGHEIEKISDVDAESADFLARTMILATPEDYLLCFSSLILLSAKSKQASKRKNKSYSFKGLVAKAIDASIENNENFITFCPGIDRKGKPVVFVKLLGCQFCFHDVPVSPKMMWAEQLGKPQYEKQNWIRTPLQRGANQLFNYALEQENITRIYMDGSGANPKDIVFKNRRKRKKIDATLAVAGAQIGQSRQIKNNKKEIELGK